MDDEFKKRQDQFKRRDEGAGAAAGGDVSNGGSDVVARVPLMCSCSGGTSRVSVMDGCIAIARAGTYYDTDTCILYNCDHNKVLHALSLIDKVYTFKKIKSRRLSYLQREQDGAVKFKKRFVLNLAQEPLTVLRCMICVLPACPAWILIG